MTSGFKKQTLCCFNTQIIAASSLPLTAGGTDYQAYYDPNLDVTWVANANLSVGNTFGLPTSVSLGPHPTDSSGRDGKIYIDGDMTWSGALFWIDAMNADSGTGYLGFNNWRLPSLDVNGDGALVNCFGGGVAGCEDNEMGYLYWEEGITSSTPGPFSNIQLGYWYGTESASDHTDAWLIGSSGGQVTGDKHNDFFVWAVRSGDVSAVPILAAAWLFGSSLMGLVGIARKKTA